MSPGGDIAEPKCARGALEALQMQAIYLAPGKRITAFQAPALEFCESCQRREDEHLARAERGLLGTPFRFPMVLKCVLRVVVWAGGECVDFGQRAAQEVEHLDQTCNMYLVHSLRNDPLVLVMIRLPRPSM